MKSFIKRLKGRFAHFGPRPVRAMTARQIEREIEASWEIAFAAAAGKPPPALDDAARQWDAAMAAGASWHDPARIGRRA